MGIEEQDLLKDSKVIPSDYGTLATSARRASSSSSTTQSDANLEEAFAGETTGLLGGRTEDISKWDEAVVAGTVRTSYTREAKTLVKYSAPLWLTFLLQYSLTFASLFSAGTLGKNELAAVTLASMTANITGYAVFQGLSTALDTLCAQAYGSGNKTLVGLHLQRMIWFLGLVSVPIITTWYFAEPILNAVIPEPELAVLSGRYLRIFTASTFVLLICAPVNAVLNYLLVWHPTIGLGFNGAPIAVIIVDWLMPTLLFCYVYFIGGRECWGGFTKRGFQNWWPMIKLSFPGLVMIEAEYLAFELLTLMSARFGTSYLAAQSILATGTTISYQLPFALSIAASTRVANFLGASMGDAAKVSARTGFMAAILVGIFNLCTIFSVRKQFAKLFTADAEIISLVVHVMPLTAAFQLFDALACLGSGLLRGQGRQHIGSYINIVGYYGIAMPVSVVCAFALGWKLMGLWCGVATALAFVSSLQLFIILRTNWDEVWKLTSHSPSDSTELT
ncbi:MATE efflux family protein [Choiromyces venosus 120613-1]|uniref:MATE efflux family protein n=1 Tax=Choiromyces venosus 120613-1 TaxID=1336337 RepID=A0A3N4K3Y0_9PEZI|nr:MATE efflux family protein [Choiromyces venosus 120613-1]